MEIIKDEEIQQTANLTPNVPPQQKKQPPVSLSNYQKALLTAFQAQPETMKLLQAVFQHYPQLILNEHVCSRQNATRKQRQSLSSIRTQRLKIEAYIEETIATLSGIDIEQLKALDKPKVQESDDGTSD